MFCASYGTQGSDGAAFCARCDAALEASAPRQPIVVGGITFTPSIGPYAGLYTAKSGGPWVRRAPSREVLPWLS